MEQPKFEHVMQKARNIAHHRQKTITGKCVMLSLWHKDFMSWINIPCDTDILDMASLFCSGFTDVVINAPIAENQFTLFASNLSILGKQGVSNVFCCNNFSLVSAQKVCDGARDCSFDEDENLCGNIINNITIQDMMFDSRRNDETIILQSDTKENKQRQIYSCTHKRIECLYDIGDTRTDRKQVHCSTGQHLMFCKHFHCTSTFKCPDYYCVPWMYVCDGFWDCPGGYDEIPCSLVFRPGFYHCSHSRINILPESICDHILDCPEKDDEQDCILHGIVCPAKCTCIHLSLVCVGAHQIDEAAVLPFEFVLFRNQDSPFPVVCSVVETFRQSRFLQLENSHYPGMCVSVQDVLLKHLYIFTATRCDIQHLKSKCFLSITNIRVLRLAANAISEIRQDAFFDTNYVQELVLSNNGLTHLCEEVFNNLENLLWLDLTFNQISQIEHNMFNSSTSQVIGVFSESFLFCCLGSKVKCSVYVSFSCKRFLQDPYVGIVLWIVGIMTFTVNAVVLVKNISNMLASKLYTTKIYTKLLLCNTCSHILFALYVFILSTTDEYLGNFYILNSFSWEQRFTCNFICFLFTFVVFLSAVSVMTYSYSKYSVIHGPMRSFFKKGSVVSKIIFLEICITLCFSSILTVLFSVFNRKEIPTYFCSPVSNKDDFTVFVLFVPVLSLVGVVSSLTVPVLYSKVVIEVKQQRTQSLIKQKTYHNTLMKHGAVHSLCNLLSWFPPSVLMLSSMFRYNYPPEALIWTFAVVLPFNPIVQPLLLDKHLSSFLLNMCKKKKPLKRGDSILIECGKSIELRSGQFLSESSCVSSDTNISHQ